MPVIRLQSTPTQKLYLLANSNEYIGERGGQMRDGQVNSIFPSLHPQSLGRESVILPQTSHFIPHTKICKDTIFKIRLGGKITLIDVTQQGFFPGVGLGGPPIRRKFCQSPHLTLVPVFGPRLVPPPSRGSSPKI